jgi:hypothetical protein
MTEVAERKIILGPQCAPIPERLLLAHARGHVLFITGAGTSLPAGLPDFRDLVLQTYERLDAATHAVLRLVPREPNPPEPDEANTLPPQQRAEVKRFLRADYDVVLGMLERRMEGSSRGATNVRRTVAEALRSSGAKPAPIHAALMKLADRGGSVTIVTTNFDRLLEEAAKRRRQRLQTYALGEIPRPGHNTEFSGVLHIHGALAADALRMSDLILSDQDFGEFYLRRRVVPDFIYDAARLFHLVLVGYSANDPPMRYLLNAVAADGSRFSDLKERFTFVGADDPPDAVELEDWIGRGITPIPYSNQNSHHALLHTLRTWADFSAVNGSRETVDKAIRRLVRTSRSDATDADRDLFDHLVRRSDRNERTRLAELASKAKADFGWLDALATASDDRERGDA